MLVRVSIIQSDQSVSTGKEEDCLNFASKSVGNMGAILVKLLEYFDILQPFDRYPGGGKPNAGCG